MTTFPLRSDWHRQRAQNAILSAPSDHVAVIRQGNRTDRQNRLMWALIGDMQAQNDIMHTFDKNDVKLRFLNALGSEMRFLPELWGGGQFPVGQSSSALTKAQFSDLIELMRKWGAENDIRWSKASQAYAAEHGIKLGDE